jgi:hypothetical protein
MESEGRIREKKKLKEEALLITHRKNYNATPYIDVTY